MRSFRTETWRAIGSVWGIRTPVSLDESLGDLPVVEHAAWLYESGYIFFSALPLELPPVSRAGRNRTCSHYLPKVCKYFLFEYSHTNVVAEVGLEPTAPRFQGEYSAKLSYSTWRPVRDSNP